MAKTQTQPIAACAVRLSGKSSVIQLFPAGRFDAPRGSFAGSGPWVMDENAALSVIAAASQRQNDIAIDYEHQLLRVAENGKPAPAAGWIDPRSFEWRPGDGLYARVRWTEAAASAIKADEYRYLSPVFRYDPTTGQVLSLELAAITNNPAIDGMAQLAAASAHLINPQEPSFMKKKILELLGLKPDASEDEAVAALTALKSRVTTLEADLAEKDQAMAAASAPDPAQFVPVETVTEMQAQIAALTAQVRDSEALAREREVNDLVDAALAEGKLVPALDTWARNVGKKDLAVLTAYLESAPAVAALTGSQTQGKNLDEGGKPVMSQIDLAVCTSMGIDPEEYKQTLEDE